MFGTVAGNIIGMGIGWLTGSFISGLTDDAEEIIAGWIEYIF